jgi:hypothetical protein
MEKQLNFSCSHLSWTVNDWKKVVWSDKSSFEIEKLSKKIKVWCHKKEKYDLEFLQPTFKSGCTSIMVWAAFFDKTKGLLVFLPPKQQTAKDFMENVYQPHLIPFLQKKNPNHQLTFMEDNAPVHTAFASRKF